MYCGVIVVVVKTQGATLLSTEHNSIGLCLGKCVSFVQTTKDYQEEVHLQRRCYPVESVARHAQGLCAELPLNHHPDLTVFHCNCSWAQSVGCSCVVGTDQMQEPHSALLPLDLADRSDCCLCGHERNSANPCSGKAAQ